MLFSCLLTYLLTYLLTTCSTVLLEKLTGFQLVKKFPAFYETRRFITAFTNARHLSRSWARSTQSIPPIPHPEDLSQYYPPIYAWVSQVVPFPKVSPPKPCRPIRFSRPPYTLYAVPPFAIWGRAMPWWQLSAYHGVWCRLGKWSVTEYLSGLCPGDVRTWA